MKVIERMNGSELRKFLLPVGHGSHPYYNLEYPGSPNERNNVSFHDMSYCNRYLRFLLVIMKVSWVRMYMIVWQPRWKDDGLKI